MRAAIYARVSSQAQREARTIDTQLPPCRELCARFGWAIVGEYIDDGISASAGNLERRAGLLRLLADAEAGAFDVVVTYDEDRLTRSDRLRERGYILGSLQEARVKLATVSKGRAIDLDTDEGDLEVSFGGLRSSSWLRTHKKRIKDGKLRAISEGRKPAGPTPFGLRYTRAEGRWSVDESQAAVVREIVRRVTAGESCLAIADDLTARGVVGPRGRITWERHTVWRIVCSRHLIGEWRADKARKLTITVPALVDRGAWQAAQEALIAHGKRGLRRTRHVYLLEGLAVCGACGAPILVRSATPQRRGRIQPAAYVCRRRKLERRGEGRCDAPIPPVADLDARVWAAVVAELDDPGLADELRLRVERRAADQRDWTADAAGYRAHLARLERVEAGVLGRFRRGMISEAGLDTELAAIARERSALADQLETAERAARAAPSDLPADPVAWLATVRELVATATPLERQRIVRVLVEPGSAVLDRHRIRLTLRVGAASRATGAAPLALAAGSGYSSHSESEHVTLRIRLVA